MKKSRHIFQNDLAEEYGHLLMMIRQSVDFANQAYIEKNHTAVCFAMNQCFWNLGEFINKKHQEPVVELHFYNLLSKHITHFLSKAKTIAFSPQNLQRAKQLVEQINSWHWFKTRASKLSWGYFAKVIDTKCKVNAFVWYIDHAILENWSLDMLEDMLDQGAYQLFVKSE